MPLSIMAGVVRRGDTLVAAVTDTDSQRARIAGTELMTKIIYPSLKLFRLYPRREEQVFNKALVTALTYLPRFKRWRSARSAPDKTDPPRPERLHDHRAWPARRNNPPEER